MIKIIYKELPIDEIYYLNRLEFSPTGLEKNFYYSLKASMLKHGFKDPVHIAYGSEEYGDIFKVIVGNNRMVIAKELGLKLIRSIIKLLDPKNNNIKGRLLNTEQEIIELFFSKKDLEIKKKPNGVIYEVMPKNPQKHGKI